MPANIVVVLDSSEDGNRVAALLRKSDYDALAFSDPMDALSALEGASQIDLLITSVNFAAGKPHGLALARMTKIRRRNLHTIFIGPRGVEHYTENLGEYLHSPATVSQIVDHALQWLSER